MRQKKLVVIDNCEDCPHYDFDNNVDPKKWGKSWCNKMDREIKVVLPAGFPASCPLPNLIPEDKNG